MTRRLTLLGEGMVTYLISDGVVLTEEQCLAINKPYNADELLSSSHNSKTVALDQCKWEKLMRYSGLKYYILSHGPTVHYCVE